MVKLKNIVISEEIGKCDFYPENSKEPGRLVINLNTGDILLKRLPNEYGWCDSHAAHARTALMEIVKEGSIPDERLVMWY